MRRGSPGARVGWLMSATHPWRWCFGWWWFFFFSSRRRHTRSYGDWSSDVCSSDLGSVVTLTASPAAGYVFSSWSISASRNPFSLTMNSDKTIAASFSLAPPGPGLLAYSPQSPASIRTDGFRFRLSSATDSLCIVEYSTDLRNWTAFQTNQLTAGSGVEIKDFGASDDRWRFYRARRVR